MKIYIYQFADKTYAKGKYQRTTDINKARVYKQYNHAVSSRGKHVYDKGNSFNCHIVLGDGDHIIEKEVII